MRIKIINPNTTWSMTRNCEIVAKRYARAGTEVIAVSPNMGPVSIESYYDDYLSVPGLIEEIIKGDREEHCDAYVNACFGDPGLHACREATDKPVIGICEAAIAMSGLIAPNFSVVTILHRARHFLEEVVKQHGAGDRCRSVRTTDLGVLDFEHDPERGLKALAEQAYKAVHEDRAESILLGCAGFVNFVEDLEKELGVPVLDGVAPAVKLAEALVDLGKKTSKVNTYKYPEPKEIKGFAPIYQFRR